MRESLCEDSVSALYTTSVMRGKLSRTSSVTGMAHKAPSSCRTSKEHDPLLS